MLVDFLKEYIPIYAKQLGEKVAKKQAESIAYEIEEDIIDEIDYEISCMLGLNDDED